MTHNRALVWVLAFVALAVAAFALFAARPQLGEGHVALVFLLVVLGASAAGGRSLGITIAFAAFLVFDWFFLPPYNTLLVRNPFDWLVLIVFLITSVVAAQLLYRARSERAAVERAEALKEADKLKDALLASLSHDLRTPLTAIKGLAHEMQPLGDPTQFKGRIGGITSGGGTNIYSGLAPAVDALVQSKAKSKHIVLLTDGESNDRGYEDLLARMAPAQITLSTLAIGSDADTRLLTSLAHLGGGRYYFTERSTQIPRIASKETTILTRNAVVEGHVAAVVADPNVPERSLDRWSE